MNEMKAVRELLPEPAPPSMRVIAEAERRLSAELTGGSPRHRFVRGRMAFGLGLVAVAAAATVGIATVSGGSPVLPVSPVATQTPQALTTELSARTILLAAAEKAERQPAVSGRYWHTDVHDLVYSVHEKGGHRYRVVDASRTESWNPRSGGRSGELVQDLGAWPETAKDKAEWQAAGSPSAKAWVPVPNGPPLSPDMGTPRPSGREVFSPGTVKEETKYYVGKGLSAKELLALPTDPDTLRALLIRDDTAGSGTDDRLFANSVNVVLRYPITPQVRGGVFRMLAGLGAVRSLGSVKDGMGRSGQGVAINVATPAGGVDQWRLIIDPKSGAALAFETVVVKVGTSVPAKAKAKAKASGSETSVPRKGPSAKPGERTSSSVLMVAGWTNTPPAQR